MSRPLQKRKSLLEHQAVWLVLTVLGALASAGVVLAIDSGALADYALFPPILRGYTLTGLFFGVASLALALLTFLYSLRKRSLQEKMPVGTMAGWLWGHVYLGLLCVVLAVAHAGYGTIGLELTLGKTLLISLLVLVVSGLIGVWCTRSCRPRPPPRSGTTRRLPAARAPRPRWSRSKSSARAVHRRCGRWSSG